VRAGNIVLAPDPRGWGETASGGNRGGYANSYQTYMRGFLVGRYMPGLLVQDALAALAHLRSMPGVDKSRIGVMGKGNGGVVALYLALLDGGVAKVAAERAPTSYLAIAQARQHEGILDIVVPGVLEDFDLPDVARAISPRPVWLVDPRSPTGTPSDAKEYAGGGGFRVASRPEGWSFTKVYADWLGL
jgi:pimeloyl-ACP methyl ester carboxylesterase